jgi:hypothetical protein
MSDKDLHLEIPKIDFTADDIEHSISSVVKKIGNKKHKSNMILLVAGIVPFVRIDAHTAVRPEFILPPEQPDCINEINAKLIEQFDKKHKQPVINSGVNSHNPFIDNRHDEKILKTRYANVQFNQLYKKFCMIKTKRK